MIFKSTIVLLGNHCHCSRPEIFDLTELKLCTRWITTHQPRAPPSTSGLRESGSSTGAPRSGITRCLSFCAWIISLDRMSSRFIHIVAGVRISFLLKKGWLILHGWMDHILFTHHLSTDARGVSGSWPLWTVPLWTRLRKDLQDHVVTVSSLRDRHTASHSSRAVYIPTSGAQSSSSYTSLPTLFCSFLKIVAILMP